MCLLSASIARAGQGDTYVAVDLTPTGFVQSQAAGASNGAQVGFGFGASTFGAEHALLWSGIAASAVDLHPAGYQMSNAVATSGVKQVGWAVHPDTATPHAFLWSGSAANGVDLNPTEMVFSRAHGAFGDVQVARAEERPPASSNTRCSGGALQRARWTSTRLVSLRQRRERLQRTSRSAWATTAGRCCGLERPRAQST